MLDPDHHLTFVPGEPGRTAQLAIWPAPWGGDEVELVVPAGDQVRRKVTTVALHPVDDLLDELVQVGLDAKASRSARAWAEVARVALRMVAEGRMHPAMADGWDAWALGPLTPHDRSVRAALAQWLPPEAHCLAVPNSKPLRMMSPLTAVAGMWSAIADVMPRTAAAATVSMQWAWASRSLVDVTDLARSLPDSSGADRTVVGLRLVMPAADDESFRVDLQVRSVDEPSKVADVAALWQGEAEGFGAEAEADVLVALRRGSRIWPPLARMLDEAAPDELELDDDEAMELFGPLAMELTTVGVEVLVPAALTKSLEAKAHVEPPPGVGDSPSRFDLSTACQLTWRGAIDGEPLDEHELSKLAASRRPLVQLRGQWVVVDPKVVAKLGRRELIAGADAVTAALAGSAVIEGELVAVDVVGPAANFAARLRGAAEPHDLPEPAGLDAVLRPYQRRGVAWMAEMAELGLGAVLADDMGLGKTVQLIGLHLHRIERGLMDAPTLVVCPATLVGNWQRELEKFAPSLNVHRYHGPMRSLGDVGPHDVVVTTYGVVRRDQALLGDQPWGLVVADEAQQIKNPNSAVAKAMRTVPADARLALTGTPVENRLTELWALLDWTTPGLLGGVEAFRRNVAIPVERDRDEDATQRFSRVIAPFLLRRRKDDPTVAPDLPPKTETDHPVTLTTEQAALYRAVVEEILESIEKAQGIARRGLVLKLLTALKQVCNHPAHYLGQPGPLASRSGKLDAFGDLVTAISDAGDSTLVFTQYVAMGQLLVTRLGELGLDTEFLHGSLGLKQRSDMVDRFQAGEFPVFVISLKAGGTGLNLTKATHVVHYDRWWNPAVENQASDRAWRIGQDRPVQIHRLISEGTLEERIAEVLAEKAALAEAVVGSGEAWLTELSDRDLAELVELGRGEP